MIIAFFLQLPSSRAVGIADESALCSPDSGCRASHDGPYRFILTLGLTPSWERKQTPRGFGSRI